mmetsp:Transcript_6077/g.9000  ORF Transcript_6077/g.9000 Transcript_6077/m.9000 type:complete len:205 (+) Transcript_6077:4321-4935(+)
MLGKGITKLRIRVIINSKSICACLLRSEREIFFSSLVVKADCKNANSTRNTLGLAAKAERASAKVRTCESAAFLNRVSEPDAAKASNARPDIGRVINIKIFTRVLVASSSPAEASAIGINFVSNTFHDPSVSRTLCSSLSSLRSTRCMSWSHAKKSSPFTKEVLLFSAGAPLVPTNVHTSNNSSSIPFSIPEDACTAVDIFFKF